jgi:hypothetical protein
MGADSAKNLTNDICAGSDVEQQRCRRRRATQRPSSGPRRFTEAISRTNRKTHILRVDVELESRLAPCAWSFTAIAASHHEMPHHRRHEPLPRQLDR